MYLVSGAYNDIQQTTAFYSIDNRLMLALGNETTGNYTAPFVTLTDGMTVISNLEMCAIDQYRFVIDLAPFIQTYFVTRQPLGVDYSEEGILKKITISATSYNDETNPSFTVDAYCCIRRVRNPLLVTSSNWSSTLVAPNVYTSDVEMNDFSPLILPNDDYVRVEQIVYSFDTDTRMKIARSNNSVSPAATTLDVKKRLTNNQLYTVGEREIIRKNYCNKHNLLVMYLTPYGAYEYFMFDGYSTVTDFEKTSPVHNTLYKQTFIQQYGNIYGKSITETITANVMISDDIYAEKFKDVLASQQVYVYNGLGTYMNGNSWDKVVVSGSYNFNPRKGQKQTITFKKENSYLW